jgi:Holliday junction resolvase RusA-like endonuclease
VSIITITVEGPAVPKARPRFGRHGVYTPKTTRDWEAKFQQKAVEAMHGSAPLSCPVSVEVTVAFAVPKSWPRWKAKLALAGDIAHTSKPDLDNLVKSVLDSMNALVYTDDSLVHSTLCKKFYASTPELVAKVIPSSLRCHNWPREIK